MSSKCSLFHNANLFGSCIIHILYTGCAEIKKNNSDAKGLKWNTPNIIIFLKTWQQIEAVDTLYRLALLYVSLIKQQLVITHTICPIEIPALLDRWVTNTLSVKMLYLQRNFSLYTFLKNNIYLSGFFFFFNSCRRLPETNRHSSLFLH